MQLIDVLSGDSPIVLGQPHGGTYVPDDIWARLNENGQALADTDWHITRLYEGLLAGASVVRSNVHRYVIDANRDPAGASLYPGQNTTTLVPLTDFDGHDIWRDGQEPSEAEIEIRRTTYHAPYHTALLAELRRVRDVFGIAILFDCHSIRSNIPFLFDGQLPVFNTGTNNGATCDPTLQNIVTTCANTAAGYDAVINGRFKGGWTTRHYGQPADGCHAIQMEIAQRAYMHETPPWEWDQTRADRLRPVLADMLHQLSDLALSGAITFKGDSA